MSTTSAHDTLVPAARVDAALVHGIIDSRNVRSVFQPLVELSTRQVVGYESLVRGPAGPLEMPGSLLSAAAAVGRLGELDWLCRVTALRAVRRARLAPQVSVFVNVEPSTLTQRCPDDLWDELEELGKVGPRYYFEFTERAITTSPADLLKSVARLRMREHGVAVDDVGADPTSLALLPFVRPDVVKLDLRLVRHAGALQAALVANAVRAHVERTGAVVLAEGIETEEHERAALALGATHGQGWLYGRPAPLPSVSRAPDRPLRLLAQPRPPEGRTPFEVITRARKATPADRRTLLAIGRQIEDQVFASDCPPVLLTCFRDAALVSSDMLPRYEMLTKHTAFTGVFGTGALREPVPNVRGVSLDADDPLADEWCVIVVGPHFAAALVARETGSSRVLEHAVSYDRELVVTAARNLLQRVTTSS